MAKVTFSTFLNAVKGKLRTDVYLVLAGMYLLDAHVTAVEAVEVRKLLQLNCGNNTPKNIPACLRKNEIYFSPIEKGPPLKWGLTDEGLSKLRDSSGLDLPARSSAQNYDFDVGIVCALENPELSAVIQALGGDQLIKDVGAKHAHVYRQCELTTRAGAVLRVVLASSTSMGLTAAAIVTTQLVMQFRPRLVMMIGIAAGTPSGGKQFGDVLVADPSIDYASGKLVMDKGVRRLLPDPYPLGLSARVRSVLQRYSGAQPLFNEIRQRWNGKKPERPNRLHIGPLGAADQVVDDYSRITELTLSWRKLIGVEMEIYGVYRAIHESPEPKARVVSFKAICDFAAEKSDDWQNYAAFVAAEFAIEFVKREWEAVRPA